MSVRKNFRVLVVDTDRNTRQRLVDYYSDKLKRRFAPTARNMIYRATGIPDAQKKIGMGNLLFNLNLVIFSQNFPAAEIAEFREWLSCIRMGPTFIVVPSKSRSCFM